METETCAVQRRRVEVLVNKHIADTALQSLQQQLSEQIHRLSDGKDKTEDVPEPTGRTDANSDTESLSESHSAATGGGGAAEEEQSMHDSPESLSESHSAATGGGGGGGGGAEEEEQLMPHSPSPPSPPPSSSSSSLSLPSETSGQRKIISLLLEIKEEQKRQWVVLKELQARVKGSIYEEDGEALDIDLPLQTMDQLGDTEKRLKDTAAQKQMVSHLSGVGGATFEDAVRRMMQSVLSFSLGSELNWLGRGQKRSFGSTRLQGVMFRALKRSHVGKNATHHEFAEVAKRWLRYAPFRQRGSNHKQHCKPPAESMCPVEPHTDTEG